MGNVSAQMIREHPALAAFQQYIQENLHVTVRPEDILLSNSRPGDGVLELSYVQPDNGSTNPPNTYVGLVNASSTTGALRIRHGLLTGFRHGQAEYRWESWVPHNVVGACRTVQVLGGEEERQVQCAPEGSVPTPTDSSWLTPQEAWLGQWAVGNYTFVETVNFLRRWRGAKAWHAQSPTMSVLRNGRAWMTPVGSNELTLAQRLTGYGSVAGVGAITMLSGNQFSDLVGLHPDFHANERFAINAYGAYGAMSGVTSWLNRGRPAAARLSSPSLVSGLVSSALVDATLGRMYQEGSSERQALRMGAFFLPQLYRMAFGGRTLALAETRAATGISRWGGRAVAAGFYADMAYMAYDHIAHSNRETARSNLIYR
ncbi:MAG TPA: hypothetical protein VJP40_09735, partial [bacterium]|nr:hypothetical protein [bacterium]